MKFWLLILHFVRVTMQTANGNADTHTCEQSSFFHNLSFCRFSQTDTNNWCVYWSIKLIHCRYQQAIHARITTYQLSTYHLSIDKLIYRCRNSKCTHQYLHQGLINLQETSIMDTNKQQKQTYSVRVPIFGPLCRQNHCYTIKPCSRSPRFCVRCQYIQT